MIPRSSLILFCIVWFSGCSYLPQWTAADAARSKTVIEASDGEGRGILQCVGRKLEALLPANAPPMLIALGTFRQNAISQAMTPQELCLDCTTAVESALSQISPIIRYTDVGRRLPLDLGLPIKLFIEGSVNTEKIPRSGSAAFDLGAGNGWINLRLNHKTQESIAGLWLDMNALLPDHTSFHGGTAPLHITFDRSAGVETNLTGSVADLAIGADIVSRRVTSYEAILRLGIAHQVARIIGRWQAIPGYWACTHTGPDELVQSTRLTLFRDVQAKQGPRIAIGFLQELLAYNGIFLPTRSGELDRGTVSALDQFMAQRGKTFSPHHFDDTYWELLLGSVDQDPQITQLARAWEQRNPAHPVVRHPVVSPVRAVARAPRYSRSIKRRHRRASRHA